jgi:D,D-heptose 1,7-bisphosphate phosphatase
MADKAIFLDRDGTINVDKGYTYKIGDLRFVLNSILGLRKLAKSEYKLIILTNQSGIGRKYYTEEEYFAFREEMHKRLKDKGILIAAEYFCPHSSKDNCNCRKPKSGMLEQAAEDLNLDLSKCWIIGDSARDVQAGKNVGCRTIQVLTGKERPISSADFVAIDMIEAANYILNFQQ